MRRPLRPAGRRAARRRAGQHLTTQGHASPGVALVTGAARRLGCHIAEALAAAGHVVVLHYNASADEADRAAQRIAAAGGRCGLLQADLSDHQAAEGLMARCTAQFGAPALLVNNASSYLYDTPATLTAESWAANERMNLQVPVFLSRAFAAAAEGPGRSIVNMLDFKVANLNPDYFSYTVAKAGMASATRLLAMAFRGCIRVNAVAPGLTLVSGKQTAEQFHRAWAMTPLGRGPTPPEIAHAVGYLHATPSINGQILCLDGGASLQPRARDISVDPAALLR